MHRITPELWRRLKDVAAAALDQDESARAAFVDAACSGDVRLRAEVLALLASAAAATPYFEVPGGGAPPALIGAGTRIGPYRLIRELGSGGMGSVYFAERVDGQFDQRVAIKVVRGGFASSAILQRFLEERRILASLQHPNIARLLDGGTTDSGLPYVAMEFVDGEAIDAFCATRNLPLRARLTLFQQACAAVQYAHQHLVIHRDIKAGNILVTEDGAPKLLDFGIAKLLDPDTGREHGAQTTMRVMTPESASPEQLAGERLTVAADVYALGVLLYRLLTGQSPYPGGLERDTDLVRAVCEAVPDRPSARPSILDERIPSDVDTIVMKALRKEPERRYASAGQFAEDIQRFLDRRPVLAAPDSLPYRARKFLVRHRVAVAAAAAIAVAVAGGVAATWWQARIAAQERDRARRQFNAVRGLAGSMLGELNDAVERLPGSTPARAILLRRATEYLDALSREAVDDPSLRHEVGFGYLRLAMVQGGNGLPNLGDRDASKASLRKSIQLLDAPDVVADPDPRVPITLADALTQLSDTESDPAAVERDLLHAKAIVEQLPASVRSTPHGLAITQTVWSNIADMQVARKDYAAALESLTVVRGAAEAELKSTAGAAYASRDVSLVYKRLGAVLEMLHRRGEALPLYANALALDRRRVDAEPSRTLWRLDLSFSEGAIGAALMGEGDLPGARAHYERAVALRERVVADDPEEDFAMGALARGYERLATIHARQGDPFASIGYTKRVVAVYRQRLDRHPERERLWREYASIAVASVRNASGVVASATSAARRRQLAAQITPLLDELTVVQQQWTRTGHAGALLPDGADLERERHRLSAAARGT